MGLWASNDIVGVRALKGPGEDHWFCMHWQFKTYGIAPVRDTATHHVVAKGMGIPCLQCRHLIPAPVDRTSGRVWLYKYPKITCTKMSQLHQ